LEPHNFTFCKPGSHAGRPGRRTQPSTGGRSPGAIPPIAGKSAEYLREALESFRSGEREATVMGRHATGYSDEEIRQIAEYFSKQ
jgi:cytochrome c553